MLAASGSDDDETSPNTFEGSLMPKVTKRASKQTAEAKKQISKAAKSFGDVSRKAVDTAKKTAKEVAKTRDAKTAKKQAKVAQKAVGVAAGAVFLGDAFVGDGLGVGVGVAEEVEGGAALLVDELVRLGEDVGGEAGGGVVVEDEAYLDGGGPGLVLLALPSELRVAVLGHVGSPGSAA